LRRHAQHRSRSGRHRRDGREPPRVFRARRCEDDERPLVELEGPTVLLGARLARSSAAARRALSPGGRRRRSARGAAARRRENCSRSADRRRGRSKSRRSPTAPDFAFTTGWRGPSTKGACCSQAMRPTFTALPGGKA
jgi:hypothetical protein